MMAKKLPMDVVWSDCGMFDSRKVFMKAYSIYIIMARLVNITGLKWAKIYEKLHSLLIWSLQNGTSRRYCKPHILNSNQRIVYSS